MLIKTGENKKPNVSDFANDYRKYLKYNGTIEKAKARAKKVLGDSSLRPEIFAPNIGSTEHTADIKKGFDLGKLTEYDYDFLPTQDRILVKVLHNERKVGSIFMPGNGGAELLMTKAIICGVGDHVRDQYEELYDVGVIVHVQTETNWITHIDGNGVRFQIINPNDIIGIAV